MNTKDVFVSAQAVTQQREYCRLASELLIRRFGDTPRAFVHTYGCQGNVSDSERIKGMLHEMGFVFCDKPEDADLVLFNTCAVREHAETRVLGNVGALKPIKEAKNHHMIIVLCGCMMQQAHIAEKIRRSYSYVNLVFGTFAIYRFPELLYRHLRENKRIFDIKEEDGKIAEGFPVWRDRSFKAWLPIMYGCNNFCTYCIVPHVRGRERSRLPEQILAEAKELIANGAKEITLLGQNVNSYGKTPDCGMNFAQLLRKINALDGDFLIRFMTSHPKDCSDELLQTMADCEKVEHHLHLPVQSGSDRVLREMNRGYTAQEYLCLIEKAYRLMPDLAVTSDIIVGFPGEREEDFQKTLDLVHEVRFSSLFTFLYSPRQGTRAAAMSDPIGAKTKSEWFRKLCGDQEQIAAMRSKNLVDKSFRVLVEEENEGMLTGRTSENFCITFPGKKNLVGSFTNVIVTDAGNWTLSGRLAMESNNERLETENEHERYCKNP